MSSNEAETQIRRADSDDLPALADFIEPFVAAQKILPRTTGELNDLISGGFVAEQAGRIVGFVALEVYSAKLAEVRSLVVDPRTQGQGIGRRLIEACVDRAHALNILEVMAITSEEAFFQSCGFDFTLPGEKKALFIQTRNQRVESGESKAESRKD
jgi:N-acetylglutamate synthase-like GNAT family acetyltransferase